MQLVFVLVSYLHWFGAWYKRCICQNSVRHLFEHAIFFFFLEFLFFWFVHRFWLLHGWSKWKWLFSKNSLWVCSVYVECAQGRWRFVWLRYGGGTRRNFLVWVSFVVSILYNVLKAESLFVWCLKIICV